MRRALASSLVVVLGLCFAGPAGAADARYERPAPRYEAGRSYDRPDTRRRPIYPAIGLACEEGWGDNVILRCPAGQIQIRPDENDLEAWNAFTGLPDGQHRPYRQLFTWSR